VGLEQGPLSLVSTIEELLERKSSGSGLEIREYGRGGSVVMTTRHPPKSDQISSLDTSQSHLDRRRQYLQKHIQNKDRLCGLVVRGLGYRSGGPGSIPGTTRFSEKKKIKQ
jgi:hypothetical protein